MPDALAAYHPVTDGEADTTRTVDLFQHQPGRTDDLAAWCGGETFIANGAPAVLVPGAGPLPERVVGLGDYAAHTGPDDYRLERGDGFARRWAPAG